MTRWPGRTCLWCALSLCAAAAGAQEKSVNPGINNSFQNPDVAQFVERFEREGREVFDQRQKIVAAVGLRQGMAVADIGAGTGLFTQRFARQVGPQGRVYAVDIAQSFVDHIERACQDQELTNVVGVVCKPDSASLPADSIERAFICDTYHHFEFPHKTMRSIHRALRPGGELVLIDFRRVDGVSSEWIMNHVRAGQETFTQEIIAAGFRQIEEKDLLKDNYFLRFAKQPDAAGRKKQKPSEPGETDASRPRLSRLPVQSPTPSDNPSTARKVALGRQLFFDPRLSGDNRMSCASCHAPRQAFADGKSQAVGAGDKVLARNTPTVIDVGFHTSLFWDGRARTLEEQALLPIQSHDEMNQDLGELERELGELADYERQFREIFGTDVSHEGIAQALAAFQRTLRSGDSPLDRFLAGDKTALSSAARRGMELFLGEAGCVRCHHGPVLSDGKFYRLGVSFLDLGREAVTGKPADRYRFRTPSLRNVAFTAPYMHDGSLQTLDDVVMFYFRGVPAKTPEGDALDIEPLLAQSFSEMAAIVEFLRALSGRIPD